MSRVALGFVLLATGCRVPASAPVPVLVPADLSGPCIFNSVMVGPRGDVVVWAGERADQISGWPAFSVTGLTILPHDSGAYQMDGPVNARPLTFSKDGRKLYVRNGQSDVGVIEGSEPGYRPLYALHPSLSTVRLIVDEDDVRSDRLRSPAWSAGQAGLRTANRVWLGFRRDRPIVTYIDERFSIGGDVRTAGAGSALAMYGVAFAPTAARGAILAHVDDTADGAYAVPAVMEGGRSIGSVRAVTSVAGRDPRGTSESAIVLDARSNVRFDVQLVETARDMRVAIKDRASGGVRTIPICHNRVKPDVAATLEQIAVKAGGGIPYTMRGLFYLNASAVAANRLIVYLHGGPASTILEGVWRGQIRRLLATGADVAAFDYAGSSGSTASVDALRGGGMGALRSSADAIARWVEERRHRYSEIIVVGESFGAIPALLLRDGPGERYRYLLVAPILYWPSPTISGGGTALGMQRQIAFEEAALGGRAGRLRFGRDLADLVRGQQRGGRLTMVFGSADRLADYRMVPPSLRAEATPDIRVVQGASHDLLSFRPETYEALQ